MDTIVSASGTMKCHCLRLHRGDDLLLSSRALAREKNIRAGVVLSAVGCVSAAKVRDASGVTVRAIDEHCEIVSLNGTVSAQRCHLHIALSRENLSTRAATCAPGASSTPPVSWSSGSFPAWPTVWSRTNRPGTTS